MEVAILQKNEFSENIYIYIYICTIEMKLQKLHEMS